MSKMEDQKNKLYAIQKVLGILQKNEKSNLYKQLEKVSEWISGKDETTEKVFILIMSHTTWIEIIGVYKNKEAAEKRKAEFEKENMTGSGPTTGLFILEKIFND